MRILYPVRRGRRRGGRRRGRNGELLDALPRRPGAFRGGAGSFGALRGSQRRVQLGGGGTSRGLDRDVVAGDGLGMEVALGHAMIEELRSAAIVRCC